MPYYVKAHTKCSISHRLAGIWFAYSDPNSPGLSQPERKHSICNVTKETHDCLLSVKARMQYWGGYERQYIERWIIQLIALHSAFSNFSLLFLLLLLPQDFESSTLAKSALLSLQQLSRSYSVMTCQLSITTHQISQRLPLPDDGSIDLTYSMYIMLIHVSCAQF